MSSTASKHGLAADRLAFLSAFFQNFYNVDILGGKRVSDQFVQHSWNIASGASPKGTLDCVSAWLTDFRKDLAQIKIPTLVLHGDADRIVPLAVSAQRTHEMIKGSRLVVVKDGPHGLTWTHANEVNRALLDFLKLANNQRSKLKAESHDPQGSWLRRPVSNFRFQTFGRRGRHQASLRRGQPGVVATTFAS